MHPGDSTDSVVSSILFYNGDAKIPFTNCMSTSLRAESLNKKNSLEQCLESSFGIHSFSPFHCFQFGSDQPPIHSFIHPSGLHSNNSVVATALKPLC